MMGRILIIGAGFSGTMAAIRLLQNATHPLELIIIEESSPTQYFGGLAYGRDSIRWEHLLNIQAGRITGFREEPADFLQWINGEADRSQWPEKWREQVFHYSCAVPRRIYQQYLEERLQQARDQSVPGITFSIIQGEVVDLVEDQQQTFATVTYFENGNEKKIQANQVILATGHLEMSLPTFAHAVQSHPRFLLNQYSEKGYEFLRNIAREETVFIIGTGLSAFDIILSLLEREHTGSIILSSRNGFIHFTYPPNHIHDILRVRRPPFLDEEHLSKARVIQAIQEEFATISSQLHKEKPEIEESILSERIIKAWEPYIIEIVQRLHPEDVQALLSQFKSLIVTRRIGTIPEIGDRIAARMISTDGKTLPQIQIIRGIIENMTSNNPASITVSLKEAGSNAVTSLQAGVVICAMGRETDYAKTRHPLWRKLIDEHRIATPHQKTGRGIEVGEYGELVNADRKQSQLVSAVGPMRQGDEIQRHGRTGAFVFSIGTTRNQAFETAIQVLRHLEEKQGHRQRGMPQLHLSAGSDNPSRLIAREAIQMSTKGQENTVALEDQLNNIITSFSNEELVLSMKHIVAFGETEQRDATMEHILTAQVNFAMMLKELGLEKEVISAVLGETFRYIEKVAIQQLTDISTLAEKDNRS
jgi:uncharacterized NAD(P)/FAD-binding protein YdhS